ncbi:MAG: AAA family ATPase [Rhodospirillales bacterium]|nr:AAA family ATPase [Rhodospirillales bacterium]
METHASFVFIGKARAIKLKRAIKYPFMDFSTVEIRRQFSHDEIRVNRRTAPGLYRGAIPITRRADGGLELDGSGEAVDWVIDMDRFDEDTLFDRKASRGELNRRLMEDLAEEVARFHKVAEPRDDFTGRGWVNDTLVSNEASYAQFSGGTLAAERVAQFNRLQREEFEHLGDLLDERQTAGFVKECHGDLHLRNIFLANGRASIFDGIEFNKTFSIIDVFYDLAFLLMDLDRRDLRRLASIVLNRYMDAAWDTEGLRLMPLFLSMRASARAHVAAVGVAGATEADVADRLRVESVEYHDMAFRYLDVAKPQLVAVGGLSGSGKSRMGRELASFVGAAPGARIVRTDVIRKRLAGVDPLTKLGPDGYTPEMSERTYAAFYDETRKALETGQSVIADAVFSKPEERAVIADVARDMDVPFNGLWLEAPREIMEFRVTKRRRNVSDADAGVVRRQLDYDLGEITWDRIDSSGPRTRTLEKGLNILGL